MKSSNFWYVAKRSPLKLNRRFGVKIRLLFKTEEEARQKTSMK
jgi:hypothetical protein